MNRAPHLQPDQQPDRWDDHVAVYEAVFEPLSLGFARSALDHLDLRPGDRLIDVGAGCGGAALAAAERGAQVLAVDASPGMVARIRSRAAGTRGRAGDIGAVVMDGTALALPNGHFDAALSVFGVILFPDAARGMREMARVLKPNGRLAVVTWTATERYELMSRLIAAIADVRGPPAPPSVLPAQLRFRDEAVFRSLFIEAALAVDHIVRLEQRWSLPSARWIGDRIAFAPGLAAMVHGRPAWRRWCTASAPIALASSMHSSPRSSAIRGAAKWAYPQSRTRGSPQSGRAEEISFRRQRHHVCRLMSSDCDRTN